MNESQDKDAMLARIEALELLARKQQQALELLGAAVRNHQTLLTALGDLEVQRHGRHSGN